MLDFTTAATSLLAAIAAEGDRQMAEDTYRSIANALPYHLRDDLDDAWESLELA